MAGIVTELTHGVPCPGRYSFCPRNVKIDHQAWIYGCSVMSVLYVVLCLSVTHDLTWLECLYRNLNLFLWKCTKTVAARAAPFDSDMYQIVFRLGLRPRPHWGAYSARCSPRAPRWFSRWSPRGKGRTEGKEGRGSRNAQIQSWQAYFSLSYLLPAAVFTATLVHITTGGIYRHFSRS